MPRNYRKKSYRPGYRACGSMVAGDARKALTIAKSIKRLINVEVKNFDVQLTGTAITDTPLITQLSNIPQGDGVSARDGAQCKMIGLELSFALNQSTSSAGGTQIRVMLVQDKQTNQAIYTAADLLEDVTQSDALVSPRNLDNMRRFSVLLDRTWVLNIAGVTNILYKHYFKKDVLLRFDASTPSIADLTQNSMSLLLVGNEVTNDPTITLFARLRYVDN